MRHINLHCVALHYIIFACKRELAKVFAAEVYGGDGMQGLAMAETRKVTKTENISLRLDPKTKFILDFVVRMKGVRTTDLVARAIKEMADATSVGGDGYGEVARTWLNYWHPEEGVRALRLIMDADIPTTFDEDEVANFVKQHWEFFFSSQNYNDPMVSFIQVLWPDMEVYLDHWRENKAKSRWATGELMLKAIKKADMRGPDWPRKAKPALSSTPKSNDIDDEIPF